jgi:hypothetical protein
LGEGLSPGINRESLAKRFFHVVSPRGGNTGPHRPAKLAQPSTPLFL